MSSNAFGSLSDVTEKLRPASAVSNITSSPFGGNGLSSGMSKSKSSNVLFGSSTNSSVVDNQGLSSISNTSNDIDSQAPTVGTATDIVSKSTPIQFRVSSTPYGLSGTAAFASTSAGFNTKHGLTLLPSSKEVSTAGSTNGSASSLFGSNLQSNSAPMFGSNTSSSATPLYPPMQSPRILYLPAACLDHY